jgi:transposase
MGHTVRRIAPQFVKPHIKSQKNDANDAEGICEAVGRPNMRFVAVKTVARKTCKRCTGYTANSYSKEPPKPTRHEDC